MKLRIKININWRRGLMPRGKLSQGWPPPRPSPAADRGGGRSFGSRLARGRGVRGLAGLEEAAQVVLLDLGLAGGDVVQAAAAQPVLQLVDQPVEVLERVDDEQQRLVVVDL